jgi:hypothetical protein
MPLTFVAVPEAVDTVAEFALGVVDLNKPCTGFS